MSGWGQIYNDTQYMLRLQSNLLANLQEQIATGSKVIRVSDAPTDAQRILQLNTQTQSLETYIRNVQTVGQTLGAASSQLEQISKLMADATADLEAAATDTSEAQRKTYAMSIDGLLEDAVVMANICFMGQYLFSGDDTAQVPYQVVRDSTEKIVEVQYQGSHDEMPVPVAPGVEHSGVLVGEDIFGNDDREAPIFFGNTGAAPGTGTSSARGDVWLSVTHTSTTYEGGSGLAEGDDAAEDTILGDHTITISGGDTAQLDDGEEVTFVGTETNLELTNSDGDVVYVDITGANNGAWTVTGEGTLSIDDGASTVALDFAEANQVVTHSSTGKVLFVDSTGITREGVEPVRIPGTYNLFETLINARDLMLDTRGLGNEMQGDLLREAATSLREVNKSLTSGIAKAGARCEGMTTLETSLGTLKDSLDDQAETLSAADIAQVVIELTRAQTFYQMALATGGRLISLSLLDFI